MTPCALCTGVVQQALPDIFSDSMLSIEPDRLSFAISIETALWGRILCARPSFPAANTGLGFAIAGAGIFHRFRPNLASLQLFE